MAKEKLERSIWKCNNWFHSLICEWKHDEDLIAWLSNVETPRTEWIWMWNLYPLISLNTSKNEFESILVHTPRVWTFSILLAVNFRFILFWVVNFIIAKQKVYTIDSRGGWEMNFPW
jgi:hypothetical protein